MIILDTGTGGHYLQELFRKNKGINVNLQHLSQESSFCQFKKNKIQEITLREIKKQKDPIIILSCHSCYSSILDFLIKHNNRLFNSYIYEPIIPTCHYLLNHKCNHIIILSTVSTCRVGWHRRIIKQKNPKAMVSYISLPELPAAIDHHQNLKKLLQKLSLYQSLVKKCDCLVLGCSHFNGIEKLIGQQLRQYSFSGSIVNTEKILYQFMSKQKMVCF